MAASRSSARTRRRGSSAGASDGSRPGQRGRARHRRLPPERADPAQRVLGQAQAGVAMRPVDQQPGAELGLGIDAFVGERERVGRIRPARQHRPALDQDQLAGDRHERADVAEPIGLQPAERVEVGVGERPERHGQDVELARLDERQQQRRAARRTRPSGPASGSPAGDPHRSDRRRGAHVGRRGAVDRRHDRDPGRPSPVISWPRPRDGAARRTRDRSGRPGRG